MLVRQFEGGRGERASQPLRPEERSEALRLVGNYRLFLAGHASEPIEFAPKIPGAGFIDTCSADLSIGRALFEVKTVNRNVASKDLRQLLLYLALQSATGNRRWEQAGFFNPRRGQVYEFSVDGIVPLISGGRPAHEVFEQLIDAFSSRDVQLDSQF